MALEDVLKPLQDVDGYLATAFYDMNGDVLAMHNNSKHKVDVIGANTVGLVRAGVKAVKNADLGKTNFIQINSEIGILLCMWAVEDKSIAAVLLEPTGNVGLAKIQLSKAADAGASQLA